MKKLIIKIGKNLLIASSIVLLFALVIAYFLWMAPPDNYCLGGMNPQNCARKSIS